MHQVGGVSRLEEMEKSNQIKDRCVDAHERELWPLSFLFAELRVIIMKCLEIVDI